MKAARATPPQYISDQGLPINYIFQNKFYATFCTTKNLLYSLGDKEIKNDLKTRVKH